MRTPLRTLGLPILLAAAAAAQPGIHPDELALKPRVDDAIARGVESLLRDQQRNGSWGIHGNHVGGKTGLCAYALLKSGVQPDHPALQRAFAHLDGIEPSKTYAAACMMLAYAATGRKEHRQRVAAMFELLLRWQKPTGDWGYPESRPDLSNTQYAALGLWIANKMGLKVPPDAWRKLIDGVLRYREQPRLIDVPITTRTGTGQAEVAGFGYTPGATPTGSMTTAGVSILQICEIGLGKRLRRDERRDIDAAIETGLEWLAQNFSVTKNPGARGHKMYYLYGLERVGSLTRREQIGEHWWYLEGARHLLGLQHPNGPFNRRGEGGQVDTCFALLFLRRATSVGPMTGGSGGVARHLFAAGSERDDVALRGAGQQPLALWIEGFGPALQQRHATHGLRVLQVEYVAGERVLGQVAGAPTSAWRDDTYLHRCSALQRGDHDIRARVTLVAAEAPPGESSPVETVLSPVMRVRIRDVFAPWMKLAAQLQKDNVLRGSEVKVTASSNAQQAAFAIDGQDHTSWICAKDDATPTLTLEFEKPIKLRRLFLTQPPVHDDQVPRYDLITEVEISINKDSARARIEMHEDPLAVTVYELPKARVVRRITLTITLRVPGREPGLAGFAEVALSDQRAGKK